MSDSEEDIFLTQSSFNGSNGLNSGNDLENLLGDYENAQFSIEKATEGLVSFNQADKYEEVSIGSVDKEAETNEKKTSRGISSSQMTKSCWPGTVKGSQRTQKR